MSAVQNLNIREFMTRHLLEVFATMLATTAVPVESAELPAFAERVTGSVAFAGEQVTGAVYLHLSAAFAGRAATAMLGLGEGQNAAESDVNDAVGELANMLTGGLKSALCDTGATCAVSTPAIIRGTSFTIECSPEVERACLVFACDVHRVAVEVHIKYS